jgi:hypothetical protein
MLASRCPSHAIIVTEVATISKVSSGTDSFAVMNSLFGCGGRVPALAHPNFAFIQYCSVQTGLASDYLTEHFMCQDWPVI